MPDATFARPDLTKFCRLDDLGLEVVGQHLEPDRAVLACRVLDADDGSEGWCRRCGCQGAPRDTVTRRLAHPERFATNTDPKILALPESAWINQPAQPVTETPAA